MASEEHKSIIYKGQQVGYIIYSPRRRMSLQSFINSWEDKRAFDDWKLPPVFNYLFIDEIVIKHYLRSQGVGSAFLVDFINSQKRPTLVVLQPGVIRRIDVEYPRLLRFYRRLGFYFQRIDGLLYAFHWVD